MTLNGLLKAKEEISFKLIEAGTQEFNELAQELEEIEQEIEHLKFKGGYNEEKTTI